MSRPPDRLLNEAFFADRRQVAVHRHTLTEPYGMHWHEFYELTFVVTGAGANTINGVHYAMQPGEAFLLTPGDFHEVRPDRGGSVELCNLLFTHLSLRGDAFAAVLDDDGIGRHARFADAQDRAAWMFRIAALQDELNGCARDRELAVASDLTRLLIDWRRRRVDRDGCDAAMLKHGRDGIGVPIQRALFYIHHQFRRPITLADVADEARLSANYFSEMFRRTTGVSFQAYLQRLRLRFARSLLRASRMPVTQVAYTSGFNTLTHFERAFRREFAMAPNMARRGDAEGMVLP